MDTTESHPLRDARIEERMARTGIDEAMIERLVRTFYDRVRADATLGPIFEQAVDDWEAHLRTLMDFWSSVTLTTARYDGRPMPVHVRLGPGPEHFDRWLTLFRQTAAEVCPPAAAALFVDRAERIATSFQMGIAQMGSLRNG